MALTNSCLMLISCLMLLSLTQGLDAETELPSSRNRCPEGTNAYGSYCYYFYQDHLTWSDADLLCQNMHSGYLVSIVTQAEGNFVGSLIKESGTADGNVWIGLFDPKQNRRWHWSSGALFSYKSWASGFPKTTNCGYCASLTSVSGFKEWKDDNCQAKFSFVCKFKG